LFCPWWVEKILSVRSENIDWSFWMGGSLKARDKYKWFEPPASGI